MENNTSKKRYVAVQKVRRLKGFYIHLFIYVMVNAGLFLINLMDSLTNLWVIKSVYGWGIGLLLHGLFLYFYTHLRIQEWEDKKIRKYMDKD